LGKLYLLPSNLLEDILGLLFVLITMNIYSPLAWWSRNQPTKEGKEKCSENNKGHAHCYENSSTQEMT
jgi:hypothetical protein